MGAFVMCCNVDVGRSHENDDVLQAYYQHICILLLMLLLLLLLLPALESS